MNCSVFSLADIRFGLMPTFTTTDQPRKEPPKVSVHRATQYDPRCHRVVASSRQSRETGHDWLIDGLIDGDCYQCVSVIFDAPLLRNFIILRGSVCVTEWVASSTCTAPKQPPSVCLAMNNILCFRLQSGEQVGTGHRGNFFTARGSNASIVSSIVAKFFLC